ncbi:PAS domain-containing sensor histidine kinase [Thiovibrio frasassiensis]|uniref:histidine kinase n=1 Tax=Thiovibrio frasassiensis TaxID=2984131 RepID=A0A9X4MF05_9BACT|nr:PAS domain-containing sensor histidine kinase [Thiovibrio frasassiensis]MDG4476354.1 PAS domain-containing sensor histidine kinase [Thiovibrio frasassiensis]
MQSGPQQGRYNKAVMAFMAVLFFFMALGDFIIAHHQRDFLYSRAENQARRDLQLMAANFIEPLIKYDYESITRFILRWGEEHPEVVRLAAVGPAGRDLITFSRPKEEGKFFLVEEKVRFQGKGLLILQMVSSSTEVDGLLRKLHWQLGLASFLMTAIAGIVLWLTLRRIALAPLEMEIGLRLETEQKLASAHQQLEERVRERTVDLEGANLLLQKEIAVRHAAEEQFARLHREYELILKSAGEGIYGLDTQGRLTFINLAGLQILGFEEVELIGRHLHDFHHHVRWDGDPYGREDCPVCAAYGEGRKNRGGESYFGRKDGTVFPVEFVCTPLVEGEKVLGTVVVFEDITVRKQAEHDLLALTDTLERRVMERTARMDAANLELRETLGQLEQTQAQLVQSGKMAALGDLVAGVAHEINTPVGVGVTAASHLENKTREIVALYAEGRMSRSDLDRYLALCQEAANLIFSNLNRAAELIRSFKQVAVDQSGEGRRPFRVKEYLAEVCLSLRPVLKNTGHRLEISCPEDLELNSYPGAFSQIVTNFITNSLTHAYDEDQAGFLHVEIGLEGGNVRFAYSDDGKGMTADLVSHAFDPFFTTNREKGGSGLGLHIVYNLVTQKLLGTIICESMPGKGTSFVLFFPAVIPGGVSHG